MNDSDYPGLENQDGVWYLEGRPLPPSQAPSPSLVQRWRSIQNTRSRGVPVDDAFKGWPAGYLRFCDELGRGPWDQDEGLYTDRIDGTRGYEPGNIREVTPQGNMHNRLDNRTLADGTLLRDLAWRAGLPYSTLKARWDRGDRDPEQLTRPAARRGHRCWARTEDLGASLRVYSVSQPTSTDYPGHYAIVANLAGCHIGCEYCFSRELWSRDSGLLGWEHIVANCADYRNMIDSVVWSGGDALAQPIEPFLEEVHRRHLLNRVFVTPNHVARLRRCLERGLVDSVHYSVKPSTVPGTTWAKQEATLRELARHPEVDTALELVYTRADEPEISDLLGRVAAVLPDHEVTLTRALNPDYLRGETL